MSSVLVDRVKILIASSGSGAFSLGPAITGFRGIEALVDGAQYSYAVESGGLYEVGTGVYVAAGPQFIRTPQISSNGGAAVNFPANCQLVFTARAADLVAAGGSGGGGGSPTVTALASETLVAGNFVNLFGTGGSTLRVRNARADDPTRFANGFVLGAIGNAASGLVTLGGLNNLAVPGIAQSQVWLGVTPGSFATSPPTADGQIVQPLGAPIPGAGIYFYPQPTVLL